LKRHTSIHFPVGAAIALAAGADGTAPSSPAARLRTRVRTQLSVDSYLILAYADGDNVTMSVGFYYMTNATGRLAGTVLSGVLYHVIGLQACLWASALFVLAAGGLSRSLPDSRCRPTRRPAPTVPWQAGPATSGA